MRIVVTGAAGIGGGPKCVRRAKPPSPVTSKRTSPATPASASTRARVSFISLARPESPPSSAMAESPASRAMRS